MRLPDNPRPLTLAAALVALEGVALIVVAAVSVRSSVAAASVFFVAYGALLLAGAWALVQRAGWARGPILVSQAIWLGVAWNARNEPLVAVPLVVAGLVVIGLIVHPATMAALADVPED